MVLSFVACGAGFVLLAQLNVTATYATDLLPAFCLLGIGIGIGFVAFTVGATDGVEDRHRGLASGLVGTSQQLGAALGIAALSVVAQTATTSDGAAGQVAGFAAAFWMGAALAVIGTATAALTMTDQTA